ncbi:unnamed protein product [Nippostrongylus brasiliensis]|uniref:SGNH_hydro domain-containing protein n=1 Tax=Nippostrongylus brasiliensis TaxID=27835 RepID=A0A0N4YAV6_NIPBR|nr:unnamed protein product [Nippostrongylus brasiliensis]
MAHDWKDICVKEAVQKVLLILPDGFRDIQTTDETLEIRTYKRFSEISDMVNVIEPRHVVFVGPTVHKPLHRSSWLKLATTFAKAALAGAKVVVVAPPRGEDAWKQSRIDAREMVDVSKMSAMSMKNNIIGMIPLLESTAEPFQTMGLHPRLSSDDVYPKIAVRDFLMCLKEYVQSEIVIPKFWETPHTSVTKEPHKNHTKPRNERVHGGVMKRRGSFVKGNHSARQMMSMMMTPQFSNALPSFPYFQFNPQQTKRAGRGRRGRGRGGRQL